MYLCILELINHQMENILNFTDHGKGETIVFLHGFCESIQIWDQFKLHFKDFRIICIDLPGHGKSKGLGVDTIIEKLSDAVNRTLSSLNLNRYILVGHSLGGYVTITYAGKYHNKLAGFCLFHSSAHEDSSEKKESRDKTAEYVLKHGVEVFANPFVPPLFYSKRKEELKDDINFATTIAKKMRTEDIVNTIVAMRDRKERISVLIKAKIPVAFIVGKDDTGVPLEISLSQCYLPKFSSVLFLAETGHMGMFERELECALFLKGFFGQVYGIPTTA